MGQIVWKRWSREQRLIFYLQLYEYAKTGLAEEKIAQALNITYTTFIQWKKKNPLIKVCLKRAKKLTNKKDDAVESFNDYVAGRLSPELKKVWRKIQRCDTLKNGVERIEAILSDRGVRVRQNLFFHAWISYNFSLSKALRAVNISRSTFDLWKKDPEFLRLVEEFSEIKGDFFEEHLMMSVAGGDTSSIIFANRTYNANRGYSDKSKVDVNINETVTHNFNFINVDKLPIKLRKQLLEHHRKQIESKEVEAIPE